jgi:hypothetical protein
MTPCPSHDDEHPSLSLRDGENGRLLVHCFSCCDRLDVLAALRQRRLLDSPRSSRPNVLPKQPHKVDEAQQQRTLAHVEKLWKEARSIINTPWQTYPLQRPHRCSPNAGPWRASLASEMRVGTGQLHRRIVARCSDVRSSALRGLWRRQLTGDKPHSLGPQKGFVIQLWPDDMATIGSVHREGPETVASAALWIEHKGTPLQPARAAGCCDNMVNFPMLPGIRALTLLVDHDGAYETEPNGRGQAAADRCAQRWAAAGREATMLTLSTRGLDFNEIGLGPVEGTP